MDCSEVRDIIDAYALRAGAPEEAAQIEAHVAECVRCWDELGKAQRTAALLALSSPMKDVPAGLEERIMTIARQEAAEDQRSERRQPVFQRLRLSWASAAAGLGVASIAAMTFAGVLQAQVNDLRSQNDRIESQMSGTTQVFEGRVRDLRAEVNSQDAILTAVIKDSDQTVEMIPAGQAQASVWYKWSSDGRDGLLMCEHLGGAPEGMVYRVWFKEDATSAPSIAFTPDDDGGCLLTIDLTTLSLAPTGVGLSLEASGATSGSEDDWLDYAHFPAGN